MLRELNIENVAVIEKANIQFGEGLNILTGETGAGKSIMIDSINAILGNRTTREIVRTGEYKAVIWATFENVGPRNAAFLAEQGYPCEDGTLILHREITTDGKSQCRINGKPATAATVRDVCGSLINIHGQHDNQDLLDPEKHIFILDSFAELGDSIENYQQLYAELGRIQQELKSQTMSEEEKARRLDLLSYQIDEIEKAQLHPGEDEELSARRTVIRNAEKILGNLRAAHAALSGDGEEFGGGLEAVSTASALLEELNGCSPDTDACAARLSEAYYTLNDISSEISGFLDSFDFDAGDLAAVEERMDLIFRLKSKYGSSIEEILKFQADAQNELHSIELSDENIRMLKLEWDKVLAEADKLADEISEKRRAAAEVFSARIREELSFLNMPNVTFEAHIEQGQLNRLGRDTVEFYISANAGEEPKPMSRIASGGELSRIMLSIKNALAEKDNIETLIFDEIDTGVSGTSAGKIGLKLKQSAKTRQTICVTHSAQIAAYADTHLKISKSVQDGKTYTTVETLDRDQRKRELARIISGDNYTETALANAEEMLEHAGS